jgi:hypothetical protein
MPARRSRHAGVSLQVGKPFRFRSKEPQLVASSTWKSHPTIVLKASPGPVGLGPQPRTYRIAGAFVLNQVRNGNGSPSAACTPALRDIRPYLLGPSPSRTADCQIPAHWAVFVGVHAATASTKFVTGDRVQITSNHVNTRSTPSLTGRILL